VPVNPASTELRVDLHVPRSVNRAPVPDAFCLDPTEDRVEVLLRDAKAEVIDRKMLFGVDEVERESIVDVDGRERTDARRCPGNVEQLAEKLRSGDLVARRNDRVIEMNRHSGPRAPILIGHCGLALAALDPPGEKPQRDRDRSKKCPEIDE